MIRGALTVSLAGFILLGGYGISRIRQERTDAYNDLVEKQISLIQAGSYEEQEQIFDQASELLPSALESYYQNAYALYNQEKYEECISFIDYDICGNKKLNLMQMKMADVYYLRADSFFRIGTERTEYYRDYAIALAYAGEEKQAQKVLQQAIDYGAEDDSIYYAKGEIEKALGRLDAAIQEFGQCISLTDDNEMKARAYLMISDIYEEKGSDASRREILLKAREELPVEDQLQILQRLAAADIELADTSGKKEYRDEAIEVLTQITDQGWGTFDTLDTLAVQYEKQGNIEQARKTADRMLQDYGEDYRIYMRYAFQEIDLQEQKDNPRRDYTQFAEYYEKAEDLYKEQMKDNNTDAQMQLLEDVYRQVREGGWLE